MKRSIVVALFVFALQVYAVGAPMFAGFEIGESIDVMDADVRKARHLAAPATENLAQVKYTFFSCESTKPAEGYDEVAVGVATNKAVVSICATVKCKDADEAKRKGEEMAAKLRSEFAGRITDGGPTRLEVSVGDNYVDVELAAQEFWKNVDENNRLAAGEK